MSASPHEGAFEFLPAKLRVARPARPLLARLRLLAAAQRRPVVFIVADAGYGKTSLLYQLSDTVERVIWYTLDERDRDPAVFIQHLLAAVSPGRSGGYGAKPYDLAASSRLAGHLAQRVLARIELDPRPALLVFDDFHAAGDLPLVRSTLAELLRDRPAHLSIAVASRRPPGIPLARLRAQGLVAEIDQADLRFTREELQTLLGPGFRVAEIERLLESSGGWPAVVQLTRDALARQDRPPDGRSITAWASDLESIDAFLMEEVLDGLGANELALLARLSIPATLDTAAVGVLTGDGDPGALLLGMAGSYGFISVLDPGGEEAEAPGEAMYQIHPLVRDALESRLPADERRALASRLGDHYASSGQLHAAAAMYIKAADDEGLARLIEQSGKQLLAEGHAGSLESWLARLPTDALERRPALLTCGADVKAELGDFVGAVELYEQAITRLEQVDDPHAMIDALRRLAGLHERRGHYRQAAAALDRATALLPEHEPLLSISLQNQLATVRLYGGQPEEALSLLADVVERCRRLGLKDREAVALHNLGEARQLLGQFQPAVEAYNASLALKREAQQWSGIALTLNSLGVLHHQLGRPERAEAALEEARQVASVHDARFVLSYILSNLADVHRDRGDTGRALPLYEQSLAIKEEMGNPFAIAYTWACQAALWRQAGDLRRAREYVQRALDLRGPEAGVVERLRYREELALIELAAGRAEAAAGELEAVAAEFARLGAAYLRLQAGWHAARARWAAGSSLDPALPALLEEAGRSGFDAFVGRAVREDAAFGVAVWLDAPSALLADQLAAVESALPHLVAALAGDDEGLARRAAGLLVEMPGNEPLQALAAAARKSLPAREALERFATLSAPRLSVNAFGGLEVQRRGLPIPARAWTRRRALDLLALLLLAGRAGRSRDDLILNCWPDATPEAGVTQFHTHLRVLRSVLEPESAHTSAARYVSGDGGVYRLDFELVEHWDIERFEEALGRAREQDRRADAAAAAQAFAQAVELYRGPLFEGLAPQGDWLEPVRERFQRLALEAALRLGELRLTLGDEDGAVDAWSRALDLDEAREDAHRALMRLYLAQGRRDDALGQYRRCVAALRRDLDVDPHPETAALYRAILSG